MRHRDTQHAHFADFIMATELTGESSLLIQQHMCVFAQNTDSASSILAPESVVSVVSYFRFKLQQSVRSLSCIFPSV